MGGKCDGFYETTHCQPAASLYSWLGGFVGMHNNSSDWFRGGTDLDLKAPLFVKTTSRVHKSKTQALAIDGTYIPEFRCHYDSPLLLRRAGALPRPYGFKHNLFTLRFRPDLHLQQARAGESQPQRQLLELKVRALVLSPAFHPSKPKRAG